MGLQAVMPGRHASRRNKAHKVYPYLLRNLEVTRPNQVWAMDITYIPMKKGFMYLTAVIDLYSRCIVGWSISNNIDAEWCRDVLEEAIGQHGCPEIINTDQGSRFTSEAFTGAVLSKEIRLSMDGKEEPLTTFLSNGSGGRSNTRRSISTHRQTGWIYTHSWPNTWIITTIGEDTAAWRTVSPPRSFHWLNRLHENEFPTFPHYTENF